MLQFNKFLLLQTWVRLGHRTVKKDQTEKKWLQSSERGFFCDFGTIYISFQTQDLLNGHSLWICNSH